MSPAEREKFLAERLDLIKKRHRALMLKRPRYDDDWDVASDWELEPDYDYEALRMVEDAYELDAF